MSNSTLLGMTCAFYVSRENCPKEDVKDFEHWLESEGYSKVKSEYSNMFGTYYIDISTRTYAKAHNDALLTNIVGDQGIDYDDFKEIHRIFKNARESEKEWFFRPAFLTPVPMYLSYKEHARQKREKQIREYFSKNPSFEEWCEDVFKAIKNHAWYKEHRPDFSKEEYLECLSDRMILRDMRDMYERHEMPDSVAGQWDLITF